MPAASHHVRSYISAGTAGQDVDAGNRPFRPSSSSLPAESLIDMDRALNPPRKPHIGQVNRHRGQDLFVRSVTHGLPWASSLAARGRRMSMSNPEEPIAALEKAAQADGGAED